MQDFVLAYLWLVCVSIFFMSIRTDLKARLFWDDYIASPLGRRSDLKYRIAVILLCPLTLPESIALYFKK